MTKRNAASIYPRGCTDNDLLMHGLQVLGEAGKRHAFGLYTALVIRCAGKGHCFPKTEQLVADTKTNETAVKRDRRDLIAARLIKTENRGARGLFYFLNSEIGQNRATSDQDDERTAESGHIRPGVRVTSDQESGSDVTRTNGKKGTEEKKERGGERPRPETAPTVDERTVAVSLPPSSVSEVSAYLQEATGRPVDAELRMFMERSIQHGDVDDHVRIIAWAVAVWGKKPELLQHVRPKTLFGEKFEKYAAKAREWAREQRFETPGEKRRREEHNKIKRTEREAAAVVPGVNLEPKTVPRQQRRYAADAIFCDGEGGKTHHAWRYPAKGPGVCSRCDRLAPEDREATTAASADEAEPAAAEAQGEMLRQREANRDAPPVAPVVADDQAAEEEPVAIDPSAAEAPSAADGTEDLPADPAEHGDRPDKDHDSDDPSSWKDTPGRQQGGADRAFTRKYIIRQRLASGIEAPPFPVHVREYLMGAGNDWDELARRLQLIAPIDDQPSPAFSYDRLEPLPTADQMRAELATDSRFAGLDVEGMSDEELLSLTRGDRLIEGISDEELLLLTRGDGPPVEASPARR